MTDDLQRQVERTLGAGYHVTRELQAGMSRVFVVADESLGRNIIVKLLTPESAEGVSAERFTREVRTLARLQHPNIVPILAAGRVGESAYYTMPYVAGESALELLRQRGPLPVRDAVAVLRDVARALDFAHRQGVVHRDIKPANILVSDNAAVVSDFGIAKAVSDARATAGSETLTRIGTSIGTPAYMAPEQALADPQVDHRADIYAFGVTAYELLAGELPFSGSAAAMMKAHVAQQPRDLGTVRPGIPEGISRLVMQCLEKDPDRRPPSAAEVLERLDTASGERTSVSTGNTNRIPAVLVMGAIALVAAIALFAKLGAAGGQGGATSVAVLPFANVGRDSASEYFSDGLTEQLVGDLGKANGLRVAPRAASFSYKGKNADPRAVAREQNVEVVVTGSVRRAGSTVRLAVELVDADGRQRWARQYDREMDDVFATQEEIARDITSALKVSLGSLRSPAQATDGVTYDLFLQARHRARRAGTRAQLDSAIAALQSVIARDSTFAPAWGALAQAYRLMSEYAQPSTVLPRAKAAAVRAAQLDPTDADAGLALAAMIFNVDWNWAAAEREYQRVIALHPENVPARSAYVSFLRASRRIDEAVEQLRKQHELEWQTVTDTSGLRARQVGDFGWVLAYQGRFRESDSVFKVAIAMDTASWNLRWIHGMSLVRHDPDRAMQHMEWVRARIGDRLPQLTHLGVAYGMAGRRDSARVFLARLTELSKTRYVPKDQFAALHLALGDNDGAIRWLERAIDERHYWLPYNNGSPLFDALRYDPRFRALMKRLGVPDASL